MTAQSLPWVEPLTVAAGVRDLHWALFYSGAPAGYSGRHSYLACDVAERIVGNDFSMAEKKLSAGDNRFDNAWFGYLGYGLKDCLETLMPERPHWLTLPPLCLMRFHTIYAFDHEKKNITRWSAPDAPSPSPAIAGENKESVIPPVTQLRSPMTKQEYLEKAAAIIERIRAGDLYQANLTRKFIGEFAEKPEAFSLFKKLCEVSPAPYSAFLKLGDISVLSSSPERFLSIDAEGSVAARPIKGTSARFDNREKDRASRDALAESAKDRAENLMIVDLMRNDLARACVPGSVQAGNLFEVTTHATIHHMSSTVTGKKRPECSALDVVKECFPPGSMTGAPKIRAMNLCAELESYARGIYSGAIGWFSGDGGCDLSVAIRTLVMQDKKFEFQVGGGIVADSTPQGEYEETIEKARGILRTLGISTEAIAAL